MNASINHLEDKTTVLFQYVSILLLLLSLFSCIIGAVTQKVYLTRDNSLPGIGSWSFKSWQGQKKFGTFRRRTTRIHLFGLSNMTRRHREVRSYQPPLRFWVFNDGINSSSKFMETQFLHIQKHNGHHVVDKIYVHPPKVYKCFCSHPKVNLRTHHPSNRIAIGVDFTPSLKEVALVQDAHHRNPEVS